MLAFLDILGRVSQVDAYLAQMQRTMRLPALSVVVVYEDRAMYAKGFGAARPGHVASEITPFVLGSLSKSFTALAIMQLVELGTLDLDAPVVRYLPWFRVADQYASVCITLRHLLTHTSGLSRFLGRDLLAGRGNTTLDESVRALSTVRLVHPVGGRYEYSNLNYMVLARVLEVASGESFGVYLHRHLFQPLRMVDSATSPREVASSLAQGSRWWFGLPIAFDAPFLPDAVGAAFLMSSASDMGQWLLAHLNGGTVDGVSVLSPAGIEELHRPQVPTTKAGSMAAMGWRVEQLAGERVVRHSGEVTNYRTEMILVPERRLGVAVLTSCNNGLVAALGLDSLAPSVVRLLLGRALPKKRLSFRSFYALLDLSVVVVTGLQVWAWIRVLRGSQRPHPSSVFINLVGPVLAFWRLPRLSRVDMPWHGLRLYVPDVSLWLLTMGVASFLRGIVGLLWLLRHLYEMHAT